MTSVALLYAITSLMTTATTITIATSDSITSSKPYHKPYHHVISIRSSAQKYCGNNIVNVLRLLCDGNYFSPVKRTKQSDQSHSFDKSNLRDDITPKAVYTPPKLIDSKHYFILAKEAHNLLNKQNKDSNGFVFLRKRRGIVEECCKKACTLNELSSYCD